MTILKTDNLKFRYNATSPEYSFHDIVLQKHETLLIKGNSGSGKTTFLHLVAGILQPSNGKITIENTETSALKPHQMDKFRGKKLGVIFQENYFIESLNVLNNLTYISSLCGLKPDKTYIKSLLQNLDIEHLSSQKPSQLSRGELQRFSIARALVNKPVLLVADEPTSSLDDNNCQRFIQLIKQMCKQYNLTLIVATHDSRLKSEFDKVISLN